MSELKQNKNGFYYYDDLPQEYRHAKLSDFDNAPNRMPFLVLGNIWKVYQCYRTSSETNLDYLKEFIRKNRVFVK